MMNGPANAPPPAIPLAMNQMTRADRIALQRPATAQRNQGRAVAIQAEAVRAQAAATAALQAAPQADATLVQLRTALAQVTTDLAQRDPLTRTNIPVISFDQVQDLTQLEKDQLVAWLLALGAGRFAPGLAINQGVPASFNYLVNQQYIRVPAQPAPPAAPVAVAAPVAAPGLPPGGLPPGGVPPGGQAGVPPGGQAGVPPVAAPGGQAGVPPVAAPPGGQAGVPPGGQAGVPVPVPQAAVQGQVAPAPAGALPRAPVQAPQPLPLRDLSRCSQWYQDILANDPNPIPDKLLPTKKEIAKSVGDAEFIFVRLDNDDVHEAPETIVDVVLGKWRNYESKTKPLAYYYSRNIAEELVDVFLTKTKTKNTPSPNDLWIYAEAIFGIVSEFPEFPEFAEMFQCYLCHLYERLIPTFIKKLGVKEFNQVRTRLSNVFALYVMILMRSKNDVPNPFGGTARAMEWIQTALTSDPARIEMYGLVVIFLKLAGYYLSQSHPAEFANIMNATLVAFNNKFNVGVSLSGANAKATQGLLGKYPDAMKDLIAKWGTSGKFDQIDVPGNPSFNEPILTVIP